MTESSYADEGDIAEQATEQSDEEQEFPADANEADVAEQLAEVPDDEDAYPAG